MSVLDDVELFGAVAVHAVGVGVATHGEAVWHPSSGPYTYGEFELTSLAYNLGP